MVVFLFLSGLALLVSLTLPFREVQALVLGAGAGLLGVGLVFGGRVFVSLMAGWRAGQGAQRILKGFDGPAFLTDGRARLIAMSAPSEDFGGLVRGQGLARALTRELADPETVVRQMVTLTARVGGARHELASGRVLRVTDREAGCLLWSISELPGERGQTPLPELRLGPDNALLSMNSAAKAFFRDADGLATERIADLPLINGRSMTVRFGDEARRVTVVVSAEVEGVQRVTLVPDTSAAAERKAEPVLVQAGLLDALPVPMLKIGTDGTLIEANAEARAIFGIKGRNLPPLFELVEGMGRPISDWLRDAADGRGLLKPEIVRAVLPGQELFLQIALGRMLEDGEVVLVGILNDATELKTLEAQFVQSQKMQAIGQLAGGVAHDFNNLLTAISGHCDLLLLRHDAGDPEYSDLIQISQNANRAASLVGQLLAFSRKQNLKPQSLDIRDTMSDLAHLLNRLIGERIQLDVTHAPGPQVIRADRRQLEQVIVNLVVNARDAMPDGGTITVRSHAEFFESETYRDRARLAPGSYVVIEVEDTGVGISPDGLSKIFEPFYTTKKTGEGTGLGLSTAYGIVKQTGGYIFAKSEVGTGTTFSLYFKASEMEKPEVAVEAPKEQRAGPGDGVVLLVEDEAPVRAFATRALRLRGYTVIEAECAEDALEILTDEALSIDIFVTDVIMPGQDGPTWVRKALKQRPDTPVIFMSGYAEEGRAEKQARIPNSVFLPKPFSLQQLTTLVQERLA